VNQHAIAAVLALPGSESDPGAALVFQVGCFPSAPADFPQPPLAASGRAADHLAGRSAVGEGGEALPPLTHSPPISAPIDFDTTTFLHSPQAGWVQSASPRKD
jgi:hypothetical protein